MGNLSKYLEDTSFIRWVLEPTPELSLYWEQQIQDNTEEEKNIRLARRIILQFRSTAQRLSDEEKILLFSEILKKINDRQSYRKYTRHLTGLLRYAAVALIFFSTGALIFYRSNPVNPALAVLNTEEQASGDQVQLIRPDGENIFLNNKRSHIAYEKSGELVVDKDTLQSLRNKSDLRNTLNQLIVPFGKTTELTLPDGTKVILNAGSRLAYPEHFDKKYREVLLSGEAYFEVKHNPDYPFVVQVNDLKIKDLGTKFNVSAYPADGSVETTLTEGKVTLKKNNSGLFSGETELIPGQLASYNRLTSEMDVSSVDVSNYILWTQNMIKFESVELSRVIKKLERYFNVRFQFVEPELRFTKISGKLDLKADQTEVFDRIAHTASVTIVKSGDDKYEIRK